MTDTRYLVHGVFWDGAPPGPPGSTPSGKRDGAIPVMRLQDPSGRFRELTLDAGSRLGFRVAAGGKSCLGHHRVHGPASRDHVLCQATAPAVRGSQCERCFVLDDFRLIHDFHRGGGVPQGLRAYLMQQHWLYMATFAGGASKVGTASNLRKWNRRLAGEARALLMRAGAEGFEVVDEQWVRPGLADAACRPVARHTYPHDLGTGTHGFRIAALSGSIAARLLERCT